MDKKGPSIFAQNLVRYRKQRGLSQGDLATLAGLTRRMIGHYETQAVEPPIDKIEAIAKALGIKPAQLLENPSDATQPEFDLTGIDPRSIKKLRDILSLSPEDRNDLYRILNKMLRKNQLENAQRSDNEAKGVQS